jgi:hypothetical protein
MFELHQFNRMTVLECTHPVRASMDANLRLELRWLISKSPARRSPIHGSRSQPEWNQPRSLNSWARCHRKPKARSSERSSRRTRSCPGAMIFGSSVVASGYANHSKLKSGAGHSSRYARVVCPHLTPPQGALWNVSSRSIISQRTLQPEVRVVNDTFNLGLPINNDTNLSLRPNLCLFS